MNINSESDLHNLINNKIEESLNLEYKAAKSLAKSLGKKKEIGKDISSMANSDGGMIIYGIKEFDEKDKNHLPEKITPISRNNFPKEWIEQVINSNIFPRIVGITIYTIQLSSSANDVVYTIEIPKSDTAHQASDLRYYKRFNFESVPMYDYEIRDTMNRETYPKIELEFKIEIYTYKKYNDLMPKPIKFLQETETEVEMETSYTLKIFARNNGKKYAKYVNAFIGIPAIVVEKETLSFCEIDEDGYVQIFGENTIRDVVDRENAGTYSIPRYGPSRFDPILPRLRTKLTDLKLNKLILETEKEIKWSVYADNSEERTGRLLILEIEKETKIEKE